MNFFNFSEISLIMIEKFAIPFLAKSIVPNMIGLFQQAQLKMVYQQISPQRHILPRHLVTATGWTVVKLSSTGLQEPLTSHQCVD